MKLKFIIKLAVSLVMLSLVLRLVNIRSLTDQLMSIPFSTLISIVVIYTGGQCMSAYKWTLIARSGGVKAPYGTALKAYFIGMFVNCYGLGVVGGDLARGLLLAEGQSRKAEAVTSVLADRLHGLTVLALIGSVGALGVLAFGHYTQQIYLVYLLVVLGMGMVIGWFLGPAVMLRLVPKENRWRQKLESVLSVFPKDPVRLGLITGISICFHATQIFLHWYIAWQLGASIPLEYLLVAIPVVNILSTLPISWNGLGVRENSYAAFLPAAILSKTQAVGLGMIWLLAVVIASAIGGIVAFVTGDFENVLRKPQEEDSVAAEGLSEL